MSLTDKQRTTLLNFADAIDAATALPPKPAPAWRTASAYDTSVYPGDTYATVLVALDAPADQTCLFQCLTGNGTGLQDTDFGRVKEWLAFQPGEQYKTVQIPVTNHFLINPGKYFVLSLIGAQNTSHPVTFTKQKATITSGDAVAMTKGQARTISPLEWPVGLKLVLDEDFSNPTITDTGLDASGNACWRSKYYTGRDHGDMGYYASPETVPAATPWGTDSNGRFFIQSESFPNNVIGADGNPLLDPHGNPYDYTSVVLTTEKNCPMNRGKLVEVQCQMPWVKGSWPAAWFYPNDWSWPSVEGDLFEGFFYTSVGANKIATTTHWKDESGNHQQYDQFDFNLFVDDLDAQGTHKWGCYWGDDYIVYYLDRVPYKMIPNMWPDKDCGFAMDIAVAGSPDPTTYNAKMFIDYIKIWE